MAKNTFSVVPRERIQYRQEQPYREEVMDAVGARVILICLSDGQSVPPHYHNHTDDVFVAIDGEGVVETQEGTLSLVPGISNMVAAGTRHTVRPLPGSRVAFLVVQNKPYDNIPCESV